MTNNMIDNAKSVSRIVQEAGGKLVGRTRLQKISYILEVMGFGDGFIFSYKHYGPYSEQLASAAQTATALNWLEEEEYQANWGGKYSIFLTHKKIAGSSSAERKSIVEFANQADVVELELAATAILLCKQGYADPWLETSNRKSSKAKDGRINRAKTIISELKKFDKNSRLLDM